MISASGQPTRSGLMSTLGYYDRGRLATGCITSISNQMEFAEQVGFDGLMRQRASSAASYGLMPSPQIMAAALARRTSRAAIIMLGMSIALYRPATRAAEEIAMLDVISGGRIVAGLPLGTPMDTNFAYGANPAEFRRVYREHHDLIMRAWQEPDVFAWNGESTKLRYVNIWPRPIQQPHPPIWIPGRRHLLGDVGLLRRARLQLRLSRVHGRGIAPAQAAMDGFWSRIDARGLPRSIPTRARSIADDRGGRDGRRGAASGTSRI